jgi:hypothetical protein
MISEHAMEDDGNGSVPGEDRDDALVQALADASRRTNPVPTAVVTSAKQTFEQRRRATGAKTSPLDESTESSPPEASDADTPVRS